MKELGKLHNILRILILHIKVNLLKISKVLQDIRIQKEKVNLRMTGTLYQPTIMLETPKERWFQILRAVLTPEET
jgi:hypothetical protein